MMRLPTVASTNRGVTSRLLPLDILVQTLRRRVPFTRNGPGEHTRIFAEHSRPTDARHPLATGHRSLHAESPTWNNRE
jgi:hypothetical protein